MEYRGSKDFRTKSPMQAIVEFKVFLTETKFLVPDRGINLLWHRIVEGGNPIA